MLVVKATPSILAQTAVLLSSFLFLLPTRDFDKCFLTTIILLIRTPLLMGLHSFLPVFLHLLYYMLLQTGMLPESSWTICDPWGTRVFHAKALEKYCVSFSTCSKGRKSFQALLTFHSWLLNWIFLAHFVSSSFQNEKSRNWKISKATVCSFCRISLRTKWHSSQELFPGPMAMVYNGSMWIPHFASACFTGRIHFSREELGHICEYPREEPGHTRVCFDVSVVSLPVRNSFLVSAAES